MASSLSNETSLVRCETSKGPFTAELKRQWSPHGYDRAVHLFEQGFFDNSHFFRVVPGFLVQFGITYSTDPELKRLQRSQIPDDPKVEPRIPFTEGTMAFAGGGRDSRTTQIFISYGKNPGLGRQPWETPIGKVIEGMENVHKFYSYGDMPPWGKGPEQGPIHKGPQYIEDNFPLSDKFLSCSVQKGTSQKPKVDEANHALAENSVELKKMGNVRQPLTKAHTAPRELASGVSDHVLVIVVFVVVASMLRLVLCFRGPHIHGPNCEHNTSKKA